MASTDSTLVGGIVTADGAPAIVTLYRLVPRVTAAFDATIVAVAAVDGTSAMWNMLGLAKMDDQGVLTLVSSIQLVVNPKDPGAMSWTVALSTEGAFITASLAGAEATEITWTLQSSVVLAP